MRDRLIFTGQLLFTLLVAAFLVVPAILSISAAETLNRLLSLSITLLTILLLSFSVSPPLSSSTYGFCSGQPSLVAGPGWSGHLSSMSGTSSPSRWPLVMSGMLAACGRVGYGVRDAANGHDLPAEVDGAAVDSGVDATSEVTDLAASDRVDVWLGGGSDGSNDSSVAGMPPSVLTPASQWPW